MISVLAMGALSLPAAGNDDNSGLSTTVRNSTSPIRIYWQIYTKNLELAHQIIGYAYRMEVNLICGPQEGKQNETIQLMR